jgi:hypothetical protein
MMSELEKLAHQVKDFLQLEYDGHAIEVVDKLIEEQRKLYLGKEREGLINSLGAFVGQCIIENFGGKWQFDPVSKNYCVSFDDENRIYPFVKVAKQFEHGSEDSVRSFFRMIPFIFKMEQKAETETKEKPGKKKWWRFW